MVGATHSVTLTLEGAFTGEEVKNKEIRDS